MYVNFFIYSVCILFLYLTLSVIANMTGEFIKNTADKYTIDEARGIIVNDSYDCNQYNLLCYDDYDCRNKCEQKGISFTCKTGICNPEVDVTPIVPETCSEKNGFIYYLVGDPLLRNYSVKCMSVDPGIAVESDVDYFENLMCKGSERFEIDYGNKFPTITDCKNVEPHNWCFVPGTSIKRRHMEINEYCGSITNRIYGDSIKQDPLDY